MASMFKGTGLMALYSDQGFQADLKNKMNFFDEANCQKAYAWAQGNYNETVTIASI